MMVITLSFPCLQSTAAVGRKTSRALPKSRFREQLRPGKVALLQWPSEGRKTVQEKGLNWQSEDIPQL